MNEKLELNKQSKANVLMHTRINFEIFQMNRKKLQRKHKHHITLLNVYAASTLIGCLHCDLFYVNTYMSSSKK